MSYPFVCACLLVVGQVDIDLVDGKVRQALCTMARSVRDSRETETEAEVEAEAEAAQC